MDARETLYTTRAMRRLAPDPVPPEVIARILDAGIRAPSGGNEQAWRFLAVTERPTVAAIGELYRHAMADLFETHYKARREEVAAASPDDTRAAQVKRVLTSAQHLATYFDDTPLLIFGYATALGGGPSIYPALWQMCLAARVEGVGSTLTTVLGMFPKEVDKVLRVPSDSGYTMAGMLTMGYPTGRWDVAARKPVSKVVFAEQWGQVPSWAPDEPLWQSASQDAAV